MKVIATCLKQPHVIGVYVSGTVFQPEFYIEVADMMKGDENALPVLDWVYFGLYQSEEGNNVYTYGMTAFGKEDIVGLIETSEKAGLIQSTSIRAVGEGNPG